MLYVLKHMNIQIFKWPGFHPTLSEERWIDYVDSKQTRFSMPWNNEQEEEKDLATLLSIPVTRNLLRVCMRLDLGDKARMQCFNKELLGKWPLRRPRRRWKDNVKNKHSRLWRWEVSGTVQRQFWYWRSRNYSFVTKGSLVSQTAGFSLRCACVYGLLIGISEREKLPNGTALSN